MELLYEWIYGMMGWVEFAPGLCCLEKTGEKIGGKFWIAKTFCFGMTIQSLSL